eukprot:TRINITY_DN37295_c0_g1_i6.p1 TRINITY_DN37295_c0_g1~~TRINITY_DN37295_c0_g1_i6.p1  ORF type:complete len:118 (+),score=19.24 TRINITY_DN37295_c0_g1_i6:279-632(+)
MKVQCPDSRGSADVAEMWAEDAVKLLQTEVLKEAGLCRATASVKKQQCPKPEPEPRPAGADAPSPPALPVYSAAALYMGGGGRGTNVRRDQRDAAPPPAAAPRAGPTVIVIELSWGG